MAVNRLTIVKIAELVLGIAILCIHYNTFEERAPFNQLIVTATYAGFLIIIIGSFIGFLTGNTINKTVDLFFCVVGAVLYIISAIFSYQQFQGWAYNTSHANVGLTKAGLALIQGIVFVVDAFFTFKIE